MKYKLAEGISQATIDGEVITDTVEMDPADAEIYVDQGILIAMKDGPVEEKSVKKRSTKKK